MDIQTSHWRDILQPVYGGKRFLVAMDVLVSAGSVVGFLQALGAESVVALGAKRGIGPVVRTCTSIDLGMPAATALMDGIRDAEARLRALPEGVERYLDAWDPDRSARVISTIFSDGSAIAGREQLGPRRPEWRSLEDKMTIDALWEAVGVPHEPVRHAPAGDFDAAVDALAGPDGVVVAGDNKEGFHGAATYVRWLRTEADRPEARAFFAAHCDRVRVMPFLDGIPCSIHGIVFPEQTVGFQPVEMLVFRTAESTFVYAGSSSFWTAPEADAASMRALAERVGEHLRRSVGYRGAFTIDGVLTADGFRPTELNPRLGAALPRLFTGIDTELVLLNRAILAGHALDYRPRELQRAVLEASLTRRSGRGGITVPVHREPDRVSVRFEGGIPTPCDADDADATVAIGPGPAGSFLRVLLEPDKTPIGPSAAPRIAALAAFGNARWDLGLPELFPAPEVR